MLPLGDRTWSRELAYWGVEMEQLAPVCHRLDQMVQSPQPICMGGRNSSNARNPTALIMHTTKLVHPTTNTASTPHFSMGVVF
mmetsp:Transcript_35866/g.93689  ORF Transcript_35866/g.93689 Transcript_35866/m.93689 type:complete len:83 (+) Transcript_35866:337-585(+)